MSFLLFTLPYRNFRYLPLGEGFPRQFPWTQMVNRVLIDQIDPFHYTLTCETIHDILKVECGKTFEQMVEQRALELKNLTGKVYVMWSGGIDSSTTLLSIILNWPKEDLERVHILASYESKLEFPVFWNVIAEKFRGKIHTSYVHPEYYLKDGYIITGEHGDQIFGSDVINTVVSYLGNEAITMPWQEVMPKVYCQMFKFLSAERFISRYLPTIQFSLYPIRTVFDWVWWFNFTNKWQHVKYRLLACAPWVNPQENFPKVVHFFNTPQWQKWSMENPDQKIKNTLVTYKWAAKKFIVKEILDEKYLNKPKIGSLRSVYLNKQFYSGLDVNFNPLSYQKCMEYIRKQ